MTGLWLCRARLKSSVEVSALAPLLLPSDLHGRVAASHRLVWSIFSTGADARRDFLWREAAPGTFMALSPRPPAPSALFDIDARPFDPQLAPGDRLSFLLTANPTVSTKSGLERGARGRRVDVVMHKIKPLTGQGERAAARDVAIAEAGGAWIRASGSRDGFIIDPDRIAIDGYRQLRVPRDGAKPIGYSTLDFAGVLTVEDPARFLAALVRGLGRARAFGCGLMLIRRL